MANELPPGEFVIHVTFAPSGNLMHPVPTNDQVEAAAKAGFVAAGLPTVTMF